MMHNPTASFAEPESVAGQFSHGLQEFRSAAIVLKNKGF
jgi:hypothetical protein